MTTTHIPDLEHEPEYGKKLGDKELVEWFFECKEASESFFSDWRGKLPDLFALYGGRTLSQDQRDFLEETWRPPIEFNFAIGTLNAILGQDMANKSEVVFRGQDLSHLDGLKGEWCTTTLRFAMQRCSGLMQEWDSLLEMLLTGYGWTHAFLDVNVVPPRGSLKRVHCWEMWPDPDATEDLLSDMRWLIRDRRWTLEEAGARWPKFRGELKGQLATGKVLSHAPKAWKQHDFKRMATDNPRARFHIHEFQYKRFDPYVRFWDGEVWQDVPASEFRERHRESPDVVQQGYNYAKECFYRAYIAGDGSEDGIVLEHEKLSVPSFTYNCLTGYKDRDAANGRVKFFGPASVILDAQRYINTSLRLILETIATGSKGGGFIEEAALTTSPDQFMKDQSKPGFWHIVADGAVTEKKILTKPAVQIPQSIQEFLRLCTEAISTLTGVTDWVKGTANQERSNVLISNLQQQSMTMLLPLFEPLTQFRIRNGVLLTRILLNHLPDATINRILGEEPVEGVTHTREADPMTGEEQWIEIMDEATGEPMTPALLLRQADPTEFDVTADVGQASPTMKMAVWQVFVQTNLLGTLAEYGLPMEVFLPKLMRYLPLPSDMAKSLADELEGVTGNRPVAPEQIMQTLVQMPPEEAIALIQQAAQAITANAQQQQPQGVPQVA